MKKQFVKPEIKGIRLRENILAGSGQQVAGCSIKICNPLRIECPDKVYAARERVTFDF